MIPLFKTHFSVGKSILKIDDILEIHEENKLDVAVFVEDSFYGFRKINSKFLENKKRFIFGIRLDVVQGSQNESPSKLIFFAKNSDGIKKIKSLYSKCFSSKEQNLIFSDFSKKDFDDIKIAVPFYDSYIYNNLFHFGLSQINLDDLDHFYLVESNNHPFDKIIEDNIRKIIPEHKIEKSKSIFYKNKEDFEAFQMYKSICNRTNGKSPSHSSPNLNHFCSSDFSWESYLESNVKV